MREIIENALTRFARKKGAGLPLRIHLWNGRFIDLSEPAKNSSGYSSVISVRIRKPSGALALLRPTLSRIGAAYVEGDIEIEGSPRDAIRVFDAWSSESSSKSALKKISVWGNRWKPARRSKHFDRRAIQYHYDVSDDFYRLFLDRNLVYSCAYFRSPQHFGDSLDLAQEAKLDLICRKLLLKPGERFLDIGCGWGALLRWAAKNYGVRATGITISRRQFDHVRRMIRAENLEGHVEVLYQDYRDLKTKGSFDKIASVGMFEHVGLVQLPAYFAASQRLLREGGLMLNHGICSSELNCQKVGSSDAGTFISQYVFPNGELPHVSLAIREFSSQGFEVTDAESLRPHYVRTLDHWLSRLEANRTEAIRLAGERRYRIWRAYLAGCAHAFDKGWVTIYQLLAQKMPRNGEWTLPLTRDHLFAPDVTSARELRKQLVS